jgi:uncharacterized protein YecE (DUF72 family)
MVKFTPEVLMKVYTGTSGFSYKEWVGNFYPEGIKPANMLRNYAGQLGTVEINNTFYRMPKKEVLEHWKEETPEHFIFSIKASQKITHMKRLNGAEEETGFLLENLTVMGEKLGAILFQFPPYFKKNAERLSDFLGILPANTPAVFEFRDSSWFDDEIAGLLSKKNFIYCFSDMDKKETPLIKSTGDWGYLRLRRENYSDRDLAEWVKVIKSQDWKKALVFFKHEEAGIGPELAKRFEVMFSGKSGGKATA